MKRLKEMRVENHWSAQQIQPKVNERLKKTYAEILNGENMSTADAVKPTLRKNDGSHSDFPFC